jgi:plastocyanin
MPRPETRSCAAIAAAIAAAVLLAALSGPATAGSVAQVKMGKRQYNPRVTEIDAGSSVRWRNTSRKLHSVTSNDGLFNSAMLPGAKFRKRFGAPGVYRYHCTVHPGMRGTVRVVGET